MKLKSLFVLLITLPLLLILPVSAQQDPESPLLDQSWVRLGGPVGGIGYDIKMNPQNPDIMYVTDAWAGFHKSMDGGQTWFPINNGISVPFGPSGDSVPGFCISLDPVDPDTIWAGLQTYRGIFHSTDSGKTWELQVNGITDSSLTFRGLTVDPTNPDIIYAAVEVPSHIWAGEQLTGVEFDLVKGKVFKTVNGGDLWEEIWYGDNLARYVVIDPTDTDTIYVSTGIFDREPANSDWSNKIYGGVGILKSTDAGETWTVLDESNGLTQLNITSLMMHPQDPNTLLAGAGHGHWWRVDSTADGYYAGAYLIQDAGSTWTQTLSTHREISSVEFCTGNPEIVYAAGEYEFYRSEDGGSSWQLLQENHWGAPGRTAGIPIDIQCDPRDPNRVFINSYNGGNTFSEDGGRTWAAASQGMTGSQIRGLSIHPENPAVLYATSLEGISRTLTGGGHWEDLNYYELSGWAAGIQINTENPAEVFVSGLVYPSILHSLDEGYTWQTVEDFHSFPGPGFVQITQSKSNPDILFAASQVHRVSEAGMEITQGIGIIRSTNQGRTWETANTGLPEDLNINCVAVDPTDSSVVYAGTVFDGVYKSTDGGDTWIRHSSSLSIQDVRSLAVDPEDSSRIYAGTAGAGLYISTDGGENWVSSSAGLNPEAFITSITVDPSRSHVVWAADIQSGVYVSSSSGEVWTAHSDGLDVRAVNVLAISEDGGTLYAGTEGAGVFRLSIHNQEAFEAMAPYPTPTPPASPTPIPEPTNSTGATSSGSQTAPPEAEANGQASSSQAAAGSRGTLVGAAIAAGTAALAGGWFLLSKRKPR